MPRESTMLMLGIGMSPLYSYVMSYLHISQSTAEWIVALNLSPGSAERRPGDGRGTGVFSAPVSIIPMIAPIILPPLKAAHFDLVWFGVIMTIVMEMGLIHPPVGLNLFVIKSIAPDISLRDGIWGVVPFVALMILAVVILCIFPEIATWLAATVMGG
jgi:C4-dicarboxylate transporter, DctM subunit